MDHRRHRQHMTVARVVVATVARRAALHRRLLRVVAAAGTDPASRKPWVERRTSSNRRLRTTNGTVRAGGLAPVVTVAWHRWAWGASPWVGVARTRCRCWLRAACVCGEGSGQTGQNQNINSRDGIGIGVRTCASVRAHAASRRQ